jgi:hypothetical protein
VNALALLGARISRGPGDRDTRKKLRARPAPDEEYCARCWLSQPAALYCTVLQYMHVPYPCLYAVVPRCLEPPEVSITYRVLWRLWTLAAIDDYGVLLKKVLPAIAATVVLPQLEYCLPRLHTTLRCYPAIRTIEALVTYIYPGQFPDAILNGQVRRECTLASCCARRNGRARILHFIWRREHACGSCCARRTEGRSHRKSHCEISERSRHKELQCSMHKSESPALSTEHSHVPTKTLKLRMDGRNVQVQLPAPRF